MDGFKLIKTTFGNRKEIVGAHFNGDEGYNAFIKEVKKVYNIPRGSEVHFYSKDFIVKPNIFIYFVAQYINNLDFVLDVKVTSNATTISVRKETQADPKTVVSSCSNKLPSAKEIEGITEIHELLYLSTLENKHRTKIAKAIINTILDNNPDKRLLREEFLQLSQSIVEVFPNELKETYYVPFSKGHLAKGKLYDAYNNKRARLSLSGLIRRRLKNKSLPTAASDDSIMLSDSDIDDNQLEILKSGSADWNLVVKIWRKSYAFRKNELKIENLDIFDYMEKYKVLQHEKNYELFEIDFKIAYPLSKSIYEWKLYYNRIIDKAEKLRDNSVRDILTYIQNAEEEDSKLALSLLLVPYLLPTSRQRSKSEVQEAFIVYCKNIFKVEQEDDDDDDDDSNHHVVKRLKIVDQPKLQFVGDSNKEISFAYLDFLGRRHIFQDPLHAVEVCFRCFIASNTKYPKICEHVWLFMQKLIFAINTPEDAVIPSTNTLVNDLQQQVFSEC